MKTIKSRFAFNQNDYEKGTRLLQEYEYKGYFIREFEQKPCDKWKKAMQEENGYELITGEEIREGGYEILNSSGEVIDFDWYGMGDSATCNAENEIDFLVLESKAKKLGIETCGKSFDEIDKEIKRSKTNE